MMRAALALLALCAEGAIATDRIEVYRDPRGVLHFSNVRGAAGSAASAAVPAGRSLPLVLSAAPSVAVGEVLEVVVTIPQSAGMRGQVVLRFDAQSLSLRQASGDVELRGAGELVLFVDPRIDSVFSTVLEFDVRGVPNAVTTIRAGAGMLEDELGKRIGLEWPAPIETRIDAGA